MKIITKNDVKRAELAMSVMKNRKPKTKKKNKSLRGTSSYYPTLY